MLGKGEWTNDKVVSKWEGLYFLQRKANNIGARLLLDKRSKRQTTALLIPVIVDE